MEIFRDKDAIVLKEQDIIEKYSLNSEINFKGLINYLLKFNLSKKFKLDNKINDMTDTEKNLVKLIESIINDYNEKVDELIKFKNDNK